MRTVAALVLVTILAAWDALWPARALAEADAGAGREVEGAQRLPVLPRVPREPRSPRPPTRPTAIRPTPTPVRPAPSTTPAPGPTSGDAACSGRYHVHPAGDDASPGDAGAPFRTIQRAADVVAPGDTVCVAPGTYRERVRITRSGEPERPIVFQGAPGAVVDGGDLHDDGWVNATELGRNDDGVYPVWRKQIVVGGATPYHATLDGRYLLRLRDYDNSGRPIMADCAERPWWCRGGDLMVNGPAARNGFGSQGPVFQGWDSPGVVEAFFGVDDGWTYVAFKDGGSPNGRNLTFAPRNAGAIEVRASFIVVRGFVVRGANYPIYLVGSNTHDVTIEENTVRNGFFGIFLVGGAHHNLVRNNDVSIAYGYTMDPSDQWHWFTWNAFRNMSELHRASISMSGGGAGNVIEGNLMQEVFGGIDEDGSTRGGDGVRVRRNVVRNALNDALTITGGADSQWYDNELVQTNIGARFWPFGNGGSVAFYGNRIAQPESPLVEACLFFFRGSASDELRVYNNSCSGPVGLLFGSTQVRSGLPKLYIFDNVFSVGTLLKTHAWEPWNAVFRDPARRPEVRGNWASAQLASWMDGSNRSARERLWRPGGEPDWSLDGLRVRPRRDSGAAAIRSGSEIELPEIGAPPPGEGG